jgi:hypothetical protein
MESQRKNGCLLKRMLIMMGFCCLKEMIIFIVVKMQNMFNEESLAIKKQMVPATESPFDFENDPSYIKAKERAYEILKEAPLPEFIAKKLIKSNQH